MAGGSPPVPESSPPSTLRSLRANGGDDPVPESQAPGTQRASGLSSLEQVRLDTAEFRAHPTPDLFDDGEAFALVEDWGRQAACAALVQAGLLSGSRRVLTRAALGRDFGVIPYRRGLFDATLDLMARCGLLVIEGDLLRLGHPPDGLD